MPASGSLINLERVNVGNIYTELLNRQQQRRQQQRQQRQQRRHQQRQ